MKEFWLLQLRALRLHRDAGRNILAIVDAIMRIHLGALNQIAGLCCCGIEHERNRFIRALRTLDDDSHGGAGSP